MTEFILYAVGLIMGLAIGLLSRSPSRITRIKIYFTSPDVTEKDVEGLREAITTIVREG